MSSKHLAIGSEPVPKVDGKLRIYSMQYCPYAQRPRLILLAKNIPHDIVNIDLMKKPEWYFKIHPEGKVPALDTGSEIIVESLLICDYLDEKYPDVPMYPAETAVKEKDKQLIKKIDPITTCFYKMLIDKSKTPEEWGKELLPLLEVFESELKSRGTAYFFGDKPGMVDYMLWPWAERAPVVKLAFGKNFTIGKDKLPKLRAWVEVMLKQPAAESTFNPPEKFYKLVQAKVNQEPIDYDNV